MFEFLIAGIDPERENVAAAIVFSGVSVLGNIEADAGAMPGHFEGAGAFLDRFDDLVGDGLVDIQLRFEGIVLLR